MAATEATEPKHRDGTRIDLDRCALCTSELGFFQEMDAGPDGKRIMRTRIRCLVCHHPVENNHPLQAAEDTLAAARRERERQEQIRRDTGPRPKSAIEEFRPYDAMEQTLAEVVKTLHAQGRRLAALEKQLKAR